MSRQGATFLAEENKGLAEPRGSKALAVSAERAAAGNLVTGWSIPQWPHWRDAADKIKSYVLANLDELLKKFAGKLEEKGVTVLWAKDAAEANAHILEICRKKKVKNIVKAKSMASEEIDLNHNLMAEGITALETDLGEYIVQLAGQRPTHIVTPALHLSASEIGRLFAEKLDEPLTEEHEALTMIARKHLRQKFIEADLGISGINFGIAETGSFAVIENEGNIGLSSSTSKTHIAIMGIEKLIPSLEYLPLFLGMLPRMGTGQKLTSYVHIFNGPDTGREMYVILLDNGRTKALAEPKHRKILQCIRCGLCMYICPVYRQAGGWAYGWVYPGPLGSILTPLMLGVKTAGKLPFACTLCGACAQACPVKIDLAHQLVRLRSRAIATSSPARNPVDRTVWRSFSLMMQSSFRYKTLMKTVKLGIRTAPFMPIHPYLMGAWTRGRTIPEIPKEGSFRDWWAKTGGEE